MKHEVVDLGSLAGRETLTPKEIYARVFDVYEKKSGQGLRALVAMGATGGAMIAFGAMLYLVVISGGGAPDGVTKLVGGISFSVGLILISITGAELFTGNVMLALSVAYGRLSAMSLLRNWSLVYFSNFAGAVLIAALVAGTGLLAAGWGETLAKVVVAKTSLDPMAAFSRAVLCNILVCLAIWMSLSTKDVLGRMLCIVGPIAAFVTIGMEHSIANMALFSFAVFGGVVPPSPAMAANLALVTFGNVCGALLLCFAMAMGFGAPGNAER